MSKRSQIRLAIKLITGCIASFLLETPTFATTNNYSIGINFGSDQTLIDLTTPSSLAPTDLAGVPGVQQMNWNNALDANGTGWSGSYATPSVVASLVADTNGVAVTTTASVEWVANGTWSTSGSRGAAETNGASFFPGTPDNLLMTGYLDVTGAGTPTLITIRNLPTELTSGGYHVYVYSMGGALANRGGSIRITDTNGIPLKSYQLHTDVISPTNYIKDPGASHAVPADTGDYHVFTNVAGSDLVIEATIAVNPNTGTPRASVNAVQLIAANLSQPIVGGAFGDAQHFYVSILDLGGAAVDTTSIRATLDNQSTNVPAQANKTGGTTLVTYDLLADKGTFFASGSTHQVKLVFSDTLARSYTNSQPFTVPAYTTIPADFAISAADTNKPGFKARTYQMPVPRGPGNRGLAANAERALALGYLDPANGQPYVNSADLTATVNGFFEIPDVINLNETAGNAIGNFANDGQMPGIPGSSGTPTDFYVVEFQTYLQLSAGAYRFGVNSDDGFKLLAGRGAGDVVGVILGQQDGTRGAGDTIFDFIAPTNGFYPFRLVYNENTGANSEVEFYLVDLVTGKKTLINDLTATSPIKAYRESAVGRPCVSRTLPTRNYGFAFATDDLVIEITDGAVPVNAGSVNLTLNGVGVTNITRTGNVTTIGRTGSLSNLLPSGANNVTALYSFTEGGNTVTVTNTWSYTVVPYAIIPSANKVDPGTVTFADAGFKALVSQMDHSMNTNQGNGGRFPGDGNRLPAPEAHLARQLLDGTTGLAFPNLANLTGANPDGTFDVSSVLNFNVPNLLDPSTTPNIGSFTPDAVIPGMPGSGTSPMPPAAPTATTQAQGTENSVAEIVTYLVLKAGAYVFAVNSDDGFLAISAPDPHDTLGTRLGFFNGGRGQTSPLPIPSTTSANTGPTPGTAGGNSAFGVIVPEDAIYPVRLLWWQGGGGGNLEFMSVDKNNGIEVLINDTTLQYPAPNVPFGSSANAIAAYRTYTGQARPWVKYSVSPTPWDYRLAQTGPGPLVFKARTAANFTANDVYQVDNARPFADVTIGGVITNLSGGSVSLLLDGTNAPATITPSGGDTIVSYKPPTLLPSGSSHTASLVYAGTTNSWPFTVQTYATVPASNAVAGVGDPNSVGFQVKVVQATTGQANTAARAEAQLAGNPASVAITNSNRPDGAYIITNVINWNNNINPVTSGGALRTNGTPIGNFQANSTGWPVPTYLDDPIPGLPGTGLTTTDNSAAEVFAFLSFPAAGYYKFGVNGDDGWKVQVGTPGQTSGTVLFTIDRGGGAQDIPFSFVIAQPGLYPIRLVWYNGGGGANLEFFSYGPNNEKIPINDPNNPNAIKAYYNVNTAPRLQFTSVTASGGNLTLNWNSTGAVTLQHATLLTGSLTDWSDVTNTTATSLTLPLSSANEFFLLKQ